VLQKRSAILHNEIERNETGEGKLNLFNNPVFLAYLAGLSECRFTALLVIPERDVGEAKAVAFTQQGEQPLIATK
jgi:hypothetical protein